MNLILNSRLQLDFFNYPINLDKLLKSNSLKFIFFEKLLIIDFLLIYQKNLGFIGKFTVTDLDFFSLFTKVFFTHRKRIFDEDILNQ